MSIQKSVVSSLVAMALAALCSLLASRDAEAMLIVLPGHRAVYDTNLGVAWLRDANLALTSRFGVEGIGPDGSMNYATAVKWVAALNAAGSQCTLDGIQCINPDGSMSHTTAEAWIQGMNDAAYLGQTSWELPPTEAMDPSCNAGFDCTGSPMGELFYSELGLTPGTAVFGNGGGGGAVSFEHVQPYLYWSCSAPDPCEENQPPGQNTEWSFSFGNGFQGTDLYQNYLYVIPYFKATAAAVMVRELSAAPVSDTERNVLLSRIAAITAASNQMEKSAALAALIDELSAQSGTTFTPEDASALIGLAQAVAEQMQ
jgi:hypothetical protein